MRREPLLAGINNHNNKHENNVKAQQSNASAFGTDGNNNDVIDTSNNNDSDSNGMDDDGSGSGSASNGTFECSNSLRKIWRQTSYNSFYFD